MKNNNIENGMKVFYDGEGEWYASPLNLEETKAWAIKEFGYDESLQLFESDLDNEGAWIITEEEKYIKELNGYDEKCKGGFGDLRISKIETGKIDRLTSFRDIIKIDGYSKEPYEIASTNY